MKLEDLPEPLTRREFRLHCQMEGIPVSDDDGKEILLKLRDQCKDS